MESHTGEYLAGVIADCLKRFGIQEKVGYRFQLEQAISLKIDVHWQFHTICMDNASNCDTTASELPKYIPSFRGDLSRSRCFPHTVNLVAKVSHFTVIFLSLKY